MFRTAFVIATVVASVLFTPETGVAQTTGIKLGEKFEGELLSGNRRGGSGEYSMELPVALKAGQRISVSATVTGKNRKVGLQLVDPTGKFLDASGLTVKTSQLSFEEVSATGKYKIVIRSDQVGPFTLRATGPSDDELNVKALEEKIAELEKELADLRAKLKAKRGSKPE